MPQQELCFDNEPKRLDPRLWHGSFCGKESTLRFTYGTSANMLPHLEQDSHAECLLARVSS